MILYIPYERIKRRFLDAHSHHSYSRRQHYSGCHQRQSSLGGNDVVEHHTFEYDYRRKFSQQRWIRYHSHNQNNCLPQHSLRIDGESTRYLMGFTDDSCRKENIHE